MSAFKTQFSVSNILLVVLIVALILTMYQIDRQWQRLSSINQLMTEQAKDIRQLSREMKSLKRGLGQGQVAFNGADEEATAAAFQRSLDTQLKPDYAEGDWLVNSFASSLKTITPLVSQDVYASYVQEYVLESLTVRNPETLEWQGLIAKDWSISEDGLVITFNLRDDVVFSDGQPLTSEDVVFTYQFIMNPSIDAARERAYYEKIDSVTASGPYTVTFHFKEPYFNSMSLAGGISILAKHFYAPYLDQPDQFNLSKGLLFGSGPYRLQDPKNWSPDAGFTELLRNDRYWGVIPSFDRMAWKTIENETARLTSYRNGEIDVYNAKAREYQKLLNDDAMMERSHNFEYISPTAGYSYIGWNQGTDEKPTRFADKRVRQAMTYLLNREAMINDVLLGYAKVAVGPFNPQGIQHNPDLKPRKYNPDKARALLKEAGFEDRDGDGLLEDKEGEPLSFSLMYGQSSETVKEMALYFKDQLARAGVEMELKPTEWSVMLESITQRNFDAIMLGWSSTIESDVYQMFHSSQIKDRGDNFIGYKNPQLDKVLEQARQSVDEGERIKLWQQVEEMLYEDQPYTFLMRSKSLLFVDKRIKGLQQTRIGLNLSLTPVEVYVPTELQRYQ